MKGSIYKSALLLLLTIGFSSNISGQNSDATQLNWAIKTSVIRYFRGDFPIQIEKRLFGNHAIDIGAGITRPYEADIPNRFNGDFTPELGWSAQGSYKIYFEDSQKFAAELMYRYQLFNAKPDDLKVESELSQEGLKTYYHHFNVLFSYQVFKNHSIIRAYTGVGYYNRTILDLAEVEESELDPSLNILHTTYTHNVYKGITHSFSFKLGIEIGIGW